MTDKEKKKAKSDATFEYDICKACSSTDCTGLIPIPPHSSSEIDSYQELYDYLPKAIKTEE